jgi:tRNA nucleotidyltransferase (CCA-adding enzyme)
MWRAAACARLWTGIIRGREDRMSDYMFLLESHLSADQFRTVGEIQALAWAAGLNLFLAGGAMRDVLAGFPVRDLDFSVEGNALKFAHAAQKKHNGTVVASDDLRKSVELRFPSGVTAEIAMARSERFPKSGGRPQVTPATIHEDLRRRDFTVNAIALSLSRASLGLLIDPTNGAGDIERKELRAIHNYSFYDDPSRMLSLIRFKIRLGYAIDERTRLQFENAREAEMLTKISPEALGAEFRHIAREHGIHDLLRALEEEKLIELFSPVLPGPKLNLPGFARLQKAYQIAPFGWSLRIQNLPLFLAVLWEKLNPKERAELAKNVEISKSEAASVAKLEAAAKKLERELKSPKLQKPSRLYQAISRQPGAHVLYLLVYSQQRIVQDRIRNYFQKYLPASLEVTDEMVAAAGTPVGAAKFERAKEEMIHKRLDARPKKPEPAPEAVPPPPMSGFARGSGFRHAR